MNIDENTEDIKIIIMDYIAGNPEKLKFMSDVDYTNLKQVLQGLNKLLEYEEGVIEKENRKAFVTDTYENGVGAFARLLIISMLPFLNSLINIKESQSFFQHRHIAHAVYQIHNAIMTLDKDESNFYNLDKLLKDPSYTKILYLSLVEFYEKYFGRFSDNEEAIKLLCKYYPDKITLTTHIEEIVSALFPHIRMAGRPGDYGYAYKGLQLITEYIKFLPEEIINLLLKEYRLFDIFNEKIYRHQIYCIINYSVLSDEDKGKYKFHFLDSILLANQMNAKLYEKFKDDNSERCYLEFQQNFSESKINVLQYKETNKIKGYWTNDIEETRNFIVDEKLVIRIQLLNEEKIYITYKDEKDTRIEFPFNYKNWTLDEYSIKESEEKILRLITNEQIKVIYRNFVFSMLYLDNYRGMHNQVMDFNHKYHYCKDNKKIEKSSVDYKIPHFYGKNIHSLTCIVGKNGTGKTSTVDFLRYIFFKLIKLVNDGELICEKGLIKDGRNLKVSDVIDKNVDFLVVFQLGEVSYFITNIENIKIDSTIDIKPFIENTYNSENELSKVAYFSNMVNTNLNKDYFDVSNEYKEDKLKALQNFKVIDYSEATSFLAETARREIYKKRQFLKDIKDNKDLEVFPKEFCYYIAYLIDLSYQSKELANSLDFLNAKESLIVKSNLENKYKIINLKTENRMKDLLDEIAPFLLTSDSKLGYFSSGQYAKFTFLAKLYWFLEGYRKYHEDFENAYKKFDIEKRQDSAYKNLFTSDEVILENETALIFIDEGELYYHPEWQRLYIKTLLELIKSTDQKFNLQIVLTTNSPFIISDILGEDIVYLPEGNKEASEHTLGQNIHQLLKGDFFMSATIGGYSQQLIEKIIGKLTNKGKYKSCDFSDYFPINSKISEYDKIYSLIDEIGEPIYREKLFLMLNKSEISDENKREKLLAQQAEIERQLQEIENK